MGTVATRDARVTGSLEVHGEEARLLTNVGVTALDRTAPITLSRGGDVLVCSTSEFHLLRSGSNGALIFGLNRGALQLQSEARPQDLILTPDMKLMPVTQGLLDVSLRVTPEGDTCVENAGARAPVLLVTDAFSSANYRILPGQHLLFVKGDIHKVVDHERSSCGCPAAVQPQAIASTPGKPVTPAQAAAAHPFPEAQSTGLAPTETPGNQASAGTASTQVSTSFSYADGQAAPPVVGAPAPAAAPAASAVGVTPSSSPTTPTAPHGLGSALRRFFHRIFHPGSSPDA